MPSIELDGLEVSVYRSEQDGSLVVDITGPGDDDCEEGGVPKLRVWLNESRLYEHPLKSENKKIVVIGSLSGGLRLVGPFEDEGEAVIFCEDRFKKFPMPIWIMSLNWPNTAEDDLVG